jgi:hypothetical protein
MDFIALLLGEQMFYTQENRILKIDTPLGKDVLLLTGLSGCECISDLFESSLNITCVVPGVALCDTSSEF